MGLDGIVSLDHREASRSLGEWRAELKQFANEASGYLSPTFTLNVDKAAFKSAKDLITGLSKEERAAAVDVARINEINSRTRLNELKAIGIEERRQIAETRRESQAAARQQREEEKAARQALREQKQLGASMAREIEAGFHRGGVTINRFGDQVETVTGHLRKMREELRRASQAREELFDRASRGATIGGAAVLGLAGVSGKQFLEFDRQLRNVNSIAQLTEGELQNVGDAVKRLSDDPNIRKGPKDLAESLYTIYSSGKQGEEALSVLNDAALGASAGLTTTDTSAKVLLATLNSGIGGVDNSREAMNVLFKIVDRGVISFEQLSNTLGDVLPTAQAAGIPLQELGAAIAEMTKNGEPASVAVNDLLNLITKLIRPPKEAQGAFDALGISYGTTALHAKGLGGVLQEIDQKTRGNKDALAKLLPDMQAFRAALILLKNHGFDYRSELEAMNQAQAGNGALMNASAKQNEGAAASMDMLRKDAEKLAIEAGESLAPALRDVITEARDAIKWFNSLDDATKSSIVKWGVMGGAALILVGKIKDVVLIVKALKDMHYATATAAGIQAAAEEGAALRSSKAWLGSLASLEKVWKASALLRGATIPGLILTTAAASYSAYEGVAHRNSSDDYLKKNFGPLGQFWSWGGERLSESGLYNTGDWRGANIQNYQEYVRDMYQRGGNPVSYEDWKAGKGTQSLLDRTLASARAKSEQVHQTIQSHTAQNTYGPTAIGDTSNPLANYGHKKTDAEKAAERAEREQYRQWMQEQRNDMDASIKWHEKLADAAEQSARRQIDALKNVHDNLHGFFDNLDDEFARLNAPDALTGIVAKLDDIFQFTKRARGVQDTAGPVVDAHHQVAADLKTARSNMGSGGSIPAYMAAMLKDSGKVIGLQCGEAITKYLRESGTTKGTATSLTNSPNIGVNAQGKLPPGTIVHARKNSDAYPSGHYMVVGPDGESWVEANYGLKRGVTDKRPINWERDMAAATWGGKLHAYLPGGAGAATSPPAGPADRVTPVDLLKDFLGSTIGKRGLGGAWGPLVSPNDTNSARYAMQEYLRGPEGESFQKMTGSFLQSKDAKEAISDLGSRFQEPVKLSGSEMNQALQFWRWFTNNVDKLKAAKEAVNDLKNAANEYERSWNTEPVDFGKHAAMLYDPEAAKRNARANEPTWDASPFPWGEHPYSEYDPTAVARARQTQAFLGADDNTLTLSPFIGKEQITTWIREGVNDGKQQITDAFHDAVNNADEGFGDQTNYYNGLLPVPGENPYGEQLKSLRDALALDQERLRLGRDLTNAEEQALIWKQSGVHFTAEELAQQKEVLDVMHEIEITTQRVDTVGGTRRHMEDMEALRYKPGAQDALNYWRGLGDLPIEKRVQAFDEQNQFEEAAKTRDAWLDVFSAISQGAVQLEGGIGGALDSIAQDLQRLAIQFAEQQLFDMLLGLAGFKGVGSITNGAFAGNAAFTPRNVPGGVANPFNGSHAGGLDRVPFDGYMAMLHRDEMVLNRSDAAMMRALQIGAPATGGTHTVNVVINNPTVRNDRDLDRIVSRVTQRIGDSMGTRSLSGNRPSARTKGRALRQAMGR